jgi:hypothetical protein
MVNESERRHKIAVGLLKKLGVEYLRLEQTAAGYTYHGWTELAVANNGGKVSRRGVIRLKQAT